MRWIGTHLIRTPTNNQEIRKHWSERATSGLRHDFWALANEHGNKAPRFKTPVIITVFHEYTMGGNKKLPDTDAAYFAAKAALDGLVDARVIPNDTGEWVLSITHEAPRVSDRDALTLLLEGR